MVRQYAGEILDALSELGRKGDKLFLDAWIKNYIETGLKGNRIKNKKYTSMKKFKETLCNFKEIFYIPQ